MTTRYFNYLVAMLMFYSIYCCIINKSYLTKLATRYVHTIDFKASTNHMGRIIKEQGVDEEIIHIATLIVGNAFQLFGLTMIKSALFTTRHRLHFYVVSNDTAMDIIVSDIDNWPEDIKSRIQVSHIGFNATEWEESLPMKPKKQFDIKLIAYGSIFNSPLIFSHTSHLIYIDSDFLLLDDIAKLWDVFQEFNNHQTIATATGTRYVNTVYVKHNESFINNNLGINAGLLLLNVERLKNVAFFEKLVKCSGIKHRHLQAYDDQDLLLLYAERYPEQHYLLPCSWNFRQSMAKCNNEGDPQLRCFEAENYGVHFLHGTYFNFLMEGQFRNIFQCMHNINFHERNRTSQCLQRAVNIFYTEERNCSNKVNILKRLENTLKSIEFM